MGLDMTLKTGKFLSCRDRDTDDEKTTCKAVLAAIGLNVSNLATIAPVVFVRLACASWWKANAIHGWFVRNVPEAENCCTESLVSREQLQELMGLCKLVISNPEKANEFISPQAGVCVGSTEGDEFYFATLRDTVNQLERILTNPQFNGCEFYYSSWS